MVKNNSPLYSNVGINLTEQIFQVKTPHRWRDKRVGVDLDAPSELKLLKTFFNAKYGNKKVTVKRTRHGYHIRIYKKHSIRQNFDVRMNLGDDIARIYMDFDRFMEGNFLDLDTMFEWKKAPDGVITREEDVNVLALPFWCSRAPAEKRVKS
jgi:hypothetical protein